MEDDRAQVDLGIAADIEEAQMAQASPQPAAESEASQASESAVKQPKKRFVGRRTAAEAAAKSGVAGVEGESGTIQGEHPLIYTILHFNAQSLTRVEPSSCQG